VSRLLGWLSEHKNGVAAVVALLAVWRVARFALGSAWVLGGWDDTSERGTGRSSAGP
jgi:hypothetical protein